MRPTLALCALLVPAAAAAAPALDIPFTRTVLPNGLAAPALAEALRELEARRGPFTAEEVGKAKALLRHELVQRTERDAGLAATLGALLGAGASLEAYRTLDADLARLGDADLRQAAAARFHPERATIVVVGDLAKIRPAIEKLGLGAIEVRDGDGKKVR